MTLLKVKVGSRYKPLPGKITLYKGTLIDIDGDGAGETEDGYTIRDVRRRNKGKLTVRFEGLTLDEFEELMDLIDSAEFELTYFCGFYKTATVHPGDRNFELIHAANEDDSRWKLDINFIEN